MTMDITLPNMVSNTMSMVHVHVILKILMFFFVEDNINPIMSMSIYLLLHNHKQCCYSVIYCMLLLW